MSARSVTALDSGPIGWLTAANAVLREPLIFESIGSVSVGVGGLIVGSPALIIDLIGFSGFQYLFYGEFPSTHSGHFSAKFFESRHNQFPCAPTHSVGEFPAKAPGGFLNHVVWRAAWNVPSGYAISSSITVPPESIRVGLWLTIGFCRLDTEGLTGPYHDAIQPQLTFFSVTAEPLEKFDITVGNPLCVSIDEHRVPALLFGIPFPSERLKRLFRWLRISAAFQSVFCDSFHSRFPWFHVVISKSWPPAGLCAISAVRN
jgi:hypothetical protein